MDAKSMIDATKSLSDVLEKRFVFLRMLMFPVIVVILAFGFKPSYIQPIRNIIPHIHWVDILLKLQDTILHLLASAAFLFVLIVLGWTFLAKMLGVLFGKYWEPDWSRPVQIGLTYVFECSAWWMCFYAFSILYLADPPSFRLVLADKLAWPVTFYLVVHVIGWIFGRE